MNLHILINISSDTENLYGVRFFCSFFADSSAPCDVTLFHISSLDDSLANASKTLLDCWQNPEDTTTGELPDKARRSLAKARRDLERNETLINEIKAKTVRERYGKVKDILREGSQGLYDAMIIGRRATYTLQWMFDRPGEEIPLALINDTSLNCPLWICNEPEEGRKNVLLCFDGSKNGMRLTDHVGYILNRAKHHEVTIFHVGSSPKNDDQALFAQARALLLSHGVEAERIHTKSDWGLSIPGAILDEKNRGRYAVVAVGLQGKGGSLLNRLGLQSGTTATLLKKINKAALWCVP